MVVKEQSIVHVTGNTMTMTDRPIRVVGKLEEPLILILENVLSSEECDALIALASDRMQRSRIGSTPTVSDIRTSSSMFFEEGENEWIQTIEARLSALMQVPLRNAEPLQVLHYRPGEQYQPHYDYFTSGAVANNRISTLVMYLNDVEEGGETYFPSLQLSVAPKKGSAVYFEYFYSDNRLNERTLHAGTPVVIGEKWVATQWMRRQPFRERNGA
ncbi:prolyl 4-hydroxylase [Paenibacillus cellulosilyticus]|uniref:Prolyl 4-hydroxylase n=1 Tax=Paenibacillus cellulosilyticus TaxID=375489 RepID=A0A2V2YV86_9BACL|nr:2OG-Fe(II) oxygenase [Paenibacillus cellulosilyticus]PWW05137.1 prolyl 4-hydroxylase [Paenibacillus cellulosilyticus]QKS48682.1 2OG-Fe(II) oxygenase [Paenibacillus cellulosilyticus]